MISIKTSKTMGGETIVPGKIFFAGNKNFTLHSLNKDGA